MTGWLGRLGLGRCTPNQKVRADHLALTGIRNPVVAARKLWWRVRPPPIYSHYLLDRPYAKALRHQLVKEVALAHPMRAIEFGCLYGWSTAIISNAMPLGGWLYVYDTFEVVPMDQVAEALPNTSWALHRASIWDWIAEPGQFDFMFIDACNTNEMIEAMYRAVYPQIRAGSTVLFQGSNYLHPMIPYRPLITLGPGLAKCLP